MRPHKFTMEQIIKILAEIDLRGTSVSFIAKKSMILMQIPYTDGYKNIRA